MLYNKTLKCRNVMNSMDVVCMCVHYAQIQNNSIFLHCVQKLMGRKAIGVQTPVHREEEVEKKKKQEKNQKIYILYVHEINLCETFHDVASDWSTTFPYSPESSAFVNVCMYMLEDSVCMSVVAGDMLIRSHTVAFRLLRFHVYLFQKMFSGYESNI